jgi:hypothetical protein
MPAMTPERLWPLLAVLLPAVASLLAPMSTVDLTYGLRAGDLMLASGGLLRVDSFTYSVYGEPWLNQQWLAQVVLAAVHGTLGWAGLALLRAVLVGVVAGGVLAGCRSAGLGVRPSAGLALASFAVSAPAMALRPQLFGMACFALLLAVLAARHARPRLVWLAIPITLVWANTHGSFPLAPAAVAVALVSDLVDQRGEARQLVVVLLATLVATFVTPWGPLVWRYAVDLSLDPQLRALVSEWQPPAIASFVGLVLAVSALLVAGVVLWVARRSRAPLRLWPRVLWLGTLLFIAATAERGIAWWAIGAPVVVAELLAGVGVGVTAADRPGSAAGPARVLGLAIPAATVLAGVVLVVPWLGADPVRGPAGRLADAPEDVTDALLASAEPGQRLFAAQRWGSWLEWVAQEQPVLVDSRVELFPDGVWADHLAVSRGDPGWQAILDSWDVDYIVASRSEQAGLLDVIALDPAWQPIHSDDSGAVFSRAR